MTSPQESNLKLLQNPADDQQGGVFAARYLKWYAKLTAIAAGVLGRQEGAEDIVQHAAGLAIAKGHKFDSEGGFLSWMVNAVRLSAGNQRRKFCRRRTYSTDPGSFSVLESRSTGPGELPIDPASGELLADQASFEDQLLEALQELNSEARCCLLLRTVHELNYSEIAELLEIPAGTAMSHVYRSRQLLRRLLTNKRTVP
jgi:RNA polymerase sigma-70 factor (ECF subfamily)